MKLLIQFGKKGDSLFDHLITPIARAQNIDKILLVCRRRGPDIPKIEYHCTPGFLARFAPLAVIYEFFTLLSLALFKKPDFIGGYLLFPHVTMAFLVAKLVGKPLIASLIAGPVELFSTGSPKRYCPSGPIPIYGRIMLRLLRHSDIITTTGSVTNNFLVKCGIEEEKIYPIINPPNENRFHRVEMPKKYDLLSVSRLSYIKHIEVLLHTTARVKNKYPDVKVCIVGDGPLKEELMNLAMDLGIQENVGFIGFQKDVAYYYNSSRIFVHTSEREGFPNVFLEAMMCGLPCVVSNCGDITDIAKDGYNCIVIPEYKNHEAFADAITRLLEDEALYRKVVGNALKDVRKLSREEITITWEKIFSKYVRCKSTQK